MATLDAVNPLKPNDATVKHEKDARYERSELKIQKALQISLSKRRIDVKSCEICQNAAITRPTFSRHCGSPNEALKKYEQSLIRTFQDRLPETECSSDVVFTILLGFVRDERNYFRATLPNSNFFLLKDMFHDLKPRLVDEQTNRRIYDYYTWSQIVIIGDWANYTRFSKQTIPFYVEKMVKTELVDPTA